MGTTSFIKDALLYDACRSDSDHLCRREFVYRISCTGAPRPLGLILRVAWIGPYSRLHDGKIALILPNSFVAVNKHE
jgi:hypothetical protein